LIFLAKNFVKKNFYLLLHPMKIVPEKILSILAIGFSSLAYAAPPPPTGVPGGPPRVSVDSGVVLLFAAAILYSFYKIHQFNKKKKASI